jgi:hypothetical protein
MTEEEAESAEIILRKPLGVFDLPESVGNGTVFPHASCLELLAVFTSACSATSVVKFFTFLSGSKKLFKAAERL